MSSMWRRLRTPLPGSAAGVATAALLARLTAAATGQFGERHRKSVLP